MDIKDALRIIVVDSSLVAQDGRQVLEHGTVIPVRSAEDKWLEVGSK